MESTLKLLGLNDSFEYKQKLTATLSCYIERTVNDDGSVNYQTVISDYFLANDEWNIDFFANIEQFKNYGIVYKRRNNNIIFNFNPNINLEIKYIFYNKLFNDEWSLTGIFTGQRQHCKRLTEFINTKYPFLNSLLDLDIEKANFEWIDWLEGNNINTAANYNNISKGKVYKTKTSIGSFLKNVYQWLFCMTDEREEWEKDIWDVRKLKKYGVSYNISEANYRISFFAIKNTKLRSETKKYLKQRLLSNNHFCWSTAQNYMKFLTNFINLLCDLEPSWNDFRGLERHHVEKYIQWLNTYAGSSLNQKNANPQHYISRALTNIQNFLSYIQLKEYDIAPVKNVRMLIFPDDKPKQKKKCYDQIDYIPDYVLEQLFMHINNLHKEIIPVIWVMYKTGLRISDALSLTQDCLMKLNGKYWIVTDIEKTYVEGHKIPIDDELADILAVLANTAKQNSNNDNNPKNYIFVRYNGRRKGKPYVQSWIKDNLNAFARKYKIIDETGNLYYFKNHSFRHTYAVKMLNGGADIITVQELLAHASPEMTMRYAKLLDDTKRKTFDNIVSQGVFSFDVDGKLQKEIGEKIPQDILDIFWTDHKLTAIDNPYGTCRARLNGKCSFVKQPPCLTCSAGKPCKDLAVGFSKMDIEKYETHIKSTRLMIETASKYDRQEIVKENEELLKLYENIYNTIKQGNIIFGRIERIKSK